MPERRRSSRRFMAGSVSKAGSARTRYSAAPGPGRLNRSFLHRHKGKRLRIGHAAERGESILKTARSPIRADCPDPWTANPPRERGRDSTRANPVRLDWFHPERAFIAVFPSTILSSASVAMTDRPFVPRRLFPGPAMGAAFFTTLRPVRRVLQTSPWPRKDRSIRITCRSTTTTT